MKRIVLWTFAVAIVVALASCAAKRTMPTVDQLVDAGSNADIESMRNGRAMAMTECIDCHRFYWPDEYTAEEWEPILDRMADLSSLTPEQLEDLKVYMTAAAAAE